MAQITLQGTPFDTVGNLPEIGEKAKNFTLVARDLSEKQLSDFLGKKIILNIFPSVDTEVCATSVREFNAKMASLENTVVLCISKDLPFAQNRFCGAEGIENVVMLSDFVSGDFGKAYGLTIDAGPFKGLLSRCVIILDENGKVTYTEQVPEIANEPNYQKALESF